MHGWTALDNIKRADVDTERVSCAWAQRDQVVHRYYELVICCDRNQRTMELYSLLSTILIVACHTRRKSA